MKVATSVVLVVFILFTFVGVALAMEMSGEVTAVDAAKSTITLKSGTLEASIDCEDGSIVKDVKVGDMVTVEYKEEGGKKKATKVMPMKRKAPVGC
jgi:Neuraminidase (sialidase)